MGVDGSAMPVVFTVIYFRPLSMFGKCSKLTSIGRCVEEVELTFLFTAINLPATSFRTICSILRPNIPQGRKVAKDHERDIVSILLI